MNGFVRLRAGRRVAYTEYGDPAGRRVALYHHGQPSCRLEAEVLLPALARRPSVRLISFDRPGMGASDPVGCPSFQSWVADLTACADALGLGQFGLIGTSAGAPFLLAAAIGLRDRVTAVSLACPVAEPGPHRDNGLTGRIGRAVLTTPHITEAYLNAVRRQVERSPQRVIRVVEPLTRTERQRFEDPEAIAFAARLVTESLRGGGEGPVRELQQVARPWGLRLADVAAPVSLFHGCLDRHAPPWMSLELGRAIPRAAVRLSPGDGHFSLLENLALDVLDAATV